MKNILISALAIVALVFFSFVNLNAQENQDKAKKDMLKKQQQMKEQMKQQKELDSISEKTQATYEDELKQLIEEQKKAQSEGRGYADPLIISKGRNTRDLRRATDFYFPSTGTYYLNSGDNTTFTISKNLKDIYTFSSEFEYEVPENVTGLYFDFGSELETGTLKLTITKPDGKVFQTFSVAPIANVDWNKKFKVKEGESKTYSGTWKITISTKEAKGYYELKINSY